MCPFTLYILLTSIMRQSLFTYATENNNLSTYWLIPVIKICKIYPKTNIVSDHHYKQLVNLLLNRKVPSHIHRAGNLSEPNALCLALGSLSNILNDTVIDPHSHKITRLLYINYLKLFAAARRHYLLKSSETQHIKYIV